MFTAKPTKRSGRPRKAEEDKVQYQRIAVYVQDYKKLSDYLDKKNRKKLKRQRTKLTDAFSEMVDNYTEK